MKLTFTDRFFAQMVLQSVQTIYEYLQGRKIHPKLTNAVLKFIGEFRELFFEIKAKEGYKYKHAEDDEKDFDLLFKKEKQ